MTKKMIDPYKNMSEGQLKELAEKKIKEAWNALGYTGDPTFICIHCSMPCEYDEPNDHIHCKKCDLNWTLRSMEKDCKSMLGIE